MDALCSASWKRERRMTTCRPLSVHTVNLLWFPVTHTSTTRKMSGSLSSRTSRRSRICEQIRNPTISYWNFSWSTHSRISSHDGRFRVCANIGWLPPIDAPTPPFALPTANRYPPNSRTDRHVPHIAWICNIWGFAWICCARKRCADDCKCTVSVIHVGEICFCKQLPLFLYWSLCMREKSTVLLSRLLGQTDEWPETHGRMLPLPVLWPIWIHVLAMLHLLICTFDVCHRRIWFPFLD